MYVETFTRAKDPTRPELNEDRLVVYADRTFAVIDGVTDKSGVLHGGATGGVLAGRAIEARLRQLTDEGALATAPAVEVVASLNEAIAERYRALGMTERAEQDPNARFAAAAVVAHLHEGGLRVIAVGDSGARVDGAVVTRGRNELDVGMAAVRAAAFAALADLEPAMSVKERLEVARAYTVHGVAAPPPGVDLSAATHAAVVASARSAGRRAMAAWPAHLAERVLDGGLREVAVLRRADDDGASPLMRAGLEFGLLDGFPLRPDLVAEVTFAPGEFAVLELFSDGYFGFPAEHGRVAHWEAHFRHVESVDPYRVGAYASTKGSHGGRYADDRTVLIVRRDPPEA